MKFGTLFMGLRSEHSRQCTHAAVGSAHGPAERETILSDPPIFGGDIETGQQD